MNGSVSADVAANLILPGSTAALPVVLAAVLSLLKSVGRGAGRVDSDGIDKAVARLQEGQQKRHVKIVRRNPR